MYAAGPIGSAHCAGLRIFGKMVSKRLDGRAREVSFGADPRCIKNVSSASRVGVPSIPP